MKYFITVMLNGLICCSLLSSCNTVKGVGKDVSKGGQAIEKAAS